METTCVFVVFLLAFQACSVCSQCEVLVSESSSWPSRVFVPLNSTAVEINCTINGNGETFWAINLAEDTLAFAISFFNLREVLNSYGVFELPDLPPIQRLLINDTERNNQTIVICSRADESRQTTLFVYEPCTFDLDATDLAGKQLLTNISWSPQNLSTSLDANQAFTLTVTSANTESRTIRVTNERHYVFEAQEDAPPCEVYNFSVTATPVGATYTGDGCSVPSPVLSRMLPSLPDTTPLKLSQNYSLQSLQSGEIELTVYFQPATYCEDYPVTNYTLECEGDSMMVQFTSEKNVITARNLSENAVYLCTVYALNSVGNVSTDDALRIYTTDVQNVTVSERESGNSVTISCNFMTGSEARGCVVLLVGEVTNTTVVLKREGVATAELPHPLGCYSDVIVFDIEADGSNGSFPVPGTLVTQSLQLEQCTPTTEELTPAQGTRAWVAGVVVAVVIVVVVIFVIAGVAFYVVGKRKWNSKLSVGQFTRSYSFDNSTPFIQDQSQIASENIPIYSLPDKNKKNGVNGVRSMGDGAEREHEQETTNEFVESTEQEVNDIRLIEPVEKSDVISIDPDAPELPPPFNPDSNSEPPPNYGDICDEGTDPDNVGDNSRAESVTPKKVVPVYQEVAEAQQTSSSANHDDHVTSSAPNPNLSPDRADPPPGPIYQEVAELSHQQPAGVTPEDVAPTHESPLLSHSPLQMEQGGETDFSFNDSSFTEGSSTNVQPESSPVAAVAQKGVPIYQEVADIQRRKARVSRDETVHSRDSPPLSTSPFQTEHIETIDLADAAAAITHIEPSPPPPARPPKGIHVYQEVTEAQRDPTDHPDGLVTSSTPNPELESDNLPFTSPTIPIYHEVSEREIRTPNNHHNFRQDSPLFSHSPLGSDSSPLSYRVSPIPDFVDSTHTTPLSSRRTVDILEYPPRMRSPYRPPTQQSISSLSSRSGRAVVDEWGDPDFRIPPGGTLV